IFTIGIFIGEERFVHRAVRIEAQQRHLEVVGSRSQVSRHFITSDEDFPIGLNEYGSHRTEITLIVPVYETRCTGEDGIDGIRSRRERRRDYEEGYGREEGVLCHASLCKKCVI